MTNDELLKRISIDPGVCFGKRAFAVIVSECRWFSTYSPAVRQSLRFVEITDWKKPTSWRTLPGAEMA